MYFPEILTGLIIVAVALIVLVFLRYVPLGLWIRARSSGVPLTIVMLIGMRLRRISPPRLVDALITATKAGLDINLNQLEKHFLAGGNIERVVKALISAQQAGIKLPFEQACAIDLAGRDVLEAVQMSVIPKVIESPSVAAIARDGIELRAKARVTVRTNICANPSFETNISGWTDNSALYGESIKIARSTAQAATGSASLAISGMPPSGPYYRNT